MMSNFVNSGNAFGENLHRDTDTNLGISHSENNNDSYNSIAPGNCDRTLGENSRKNSMPPEKIGNSSHGRGKFNPTNRRNPCPVCNDTSGKCRTTDTDLLLCMSLEGDQPGFAYKGKTKDGMWSKFYPEGDFVPAPRNFTPPKPEPIALAPSDRHYWNQKLLNSLKLNPQDRADCHRRGISDQQIADWGIKSVSRYQQLTEKFPVNLPGVSGDGRSLINASAGYLTPVRDVDGFIVGFQIRTQDQNNRYKWLSSTENPVKISGELPLAVFPNGSGVALVEGTGAKPFLLSARLGVTAIGAAGGNFASSPHTLSRTLKVLQAASVIFYPDAGAVKNKHVLTQYRNTFDLLESLGCSYQIAWWGQVEKTNQDIDELEDLSKIRLISRDEFEAIAPEFLDIDKNREQDQESFIHKIFGNFREFTGRGKKPKPQPGFDVQPLPLGEIVEFAQGDRLATIQRGIEQGYKYILDKTVAGGGKSHTLAKFEPANFGVEKLIYVNTNHRNTPVAALQEWPDLTPRHHGLIKKLNPDGTIALRRVKAGENPDVAGNCHKAPLFAALANKNYRDFQTSADSPICGSCHLANACKVTTGKGFGYRSMRRSELQNSRLRAAPESIQPELVTAAGLLWDDQSLSISKTIKVTAQEIEATLGAIALDAHELIPAVAPLVKSLLSLMAEKHHHGLGETEIKKRLAMPTEFDAEQVYEFFKQRIEADLEKLNPVSEHGVALADLPKNLQKHFRDSLGEASSKVDSFIANWLLPLWEALTRVNHGSFRIDSGVLTITAPNNHDRELARAAKFNLIFDATKHPVDLAAELGCDVAEILVIRQKTPPVKNLKVVQITGVTGLTGDRSELALSRLAALKTALGSLHTNLGVIDRLAYIGDGEGAWFRDHRGSNAFIKNDALLAIGDPIMNLGAMQADYKIRYGYYPELEEAGFTAFVARRVQSEMIQAMERLRSHQRPEEQLTFYAVTERDLSFLGLPVAQRTAFEITPEAGELREQWTYKTQAAARVLLGQGQKLTQENLAKLMECCQAQIVKISKLFGGWSALKKLLQSLLEIPYRDRNNLQPDWGWFATEYLLALEKDLQLEENFANFDLEFFAELVKSAGDRAYLALAGLNPLAKGRLLGLILKSDRP